VKELAFTPFNGRAGYKGILSAVLVEVPMRITPLVFPLSLALLFPGCHHSGSGTSPLPPTIGPIAVNGDFWKDEPLIVYFSSHDTVPETTLTTVQNDLFFANPNAFQVQLSYQVLDTGFEIQEGGVALTSMAARTNSQSRPIVSSTGVVTGYTWPLPSVMADRGKPPKDKGSYSIEAANTCNGSHGTPYLPDVNASQSPCPGSSAIVLLTISPPILPAAPTHGHKFAYSLVEKGSGIFKSRPIIAESLATRHPLSTATSTRIQRGSTWGTERIRSTAGHLRHDERTASIDPKTQSLAGTFHWFGLTICFLVSAVLLLTTGAVIQARGF
jgi:hypothetical protein